MRSTPSPAAPASIPNPFAALPAADYALAPELLDRVQTPALVIRLDRVRSNVRRVLELAGGAERWRPHVKTAKVPEVLAELARAGVRRFKCATTREASVLAGVLAREGVAGDVLVAYPLRGPALRRLAAIAAGAPGTAFSVLAEDPEAVASAPDAAGIFVDVNPGMNRTGVPQGDVAAILAVARAAGERFRGLHFYDGHLHDPDPARRRAAIFAGYERLVALADRLAAEGLAPGELVTAGTPAFHHALAFPAFAPGGAYVHRVSPGTVVYHDGRSELENPELGLAAAALVLTRVISHPAPGIATCDAGSKSLAAETGDPCAFVLGDGDLVAGTPHEEHLPLRSSGPLPPRGRELLLVPRHVCPTVNLAEEALLIDPGAATRVVTVAARAHELWVDPPG